MAEGPVDIHELLQRVAPGTPLRLACERIVQQGDGALIVLGNGPSVEAVCSGGFDLHNSTFTVARVAELAKMDGAIILDDDLEHILKANVHLLPDASLPTSETGSRHRTAQRVAAQTGKPVVTVSENRGSVTLFHGSRLRELESPTALIDRVNQYLHTLERFRRRLDDAVERLDRMEVAGLGTTRHVLAVIQRAELVARIADQVEEDVIGLGGGAELIDLQLEDLATGATRVAVLVLTDYLPENSEDDVATARKAARALSAGELADPFVLSAALGLDHPDAEVEPRGIRLLAGVPRLPEAVQANMADHFPSFDGLITASVPQLEAVDGIGPTRAVAIRRYFDRWAEAAGWAQKD
jgi:diadenylate cyclase